MECEHDPEHVYLLTTTNGFKIYYRTAHFTLETTIKMLINLDLGVIIVNNNNL